MVDAVMTALGLEGNEFQRPTIEFYVDEVNEYLKDAGVPEDVIGTKPTVGIVARGVADLWSYGAGNGKLSVYFKERAIQLATADFPSPEPTPTPGGELPPVTPADDGKALMVVGGEWAAAELPDPTGGGYIIVTSSYDEELGEYSLDKTFGELVTEYEGGKLILLRDMAHNIYDLAIVSYSEEYTLFHCTTYFADIPHRSTAAYIWDIYEDGCFPSIVCGSETIDIIYEQNGNTISNIQCDCSFEHLKDKMTNGGITINARGLQYYSNRRIQTFVTTAVYNVLYDAIHISSVGSNGVYYSFTLTTNGWSGYSRTV